MLRRIVGLVLALGSFTTGLRAQSYQTSFSEVKYDRAKGPSTWHGGVEVDAATGAASLSFPLGPGIGARGAVFSPVLSGRFAPQVKCFTRQVSGPPNSPITYAEFWSLLDNGGFSLERGHLVLGPSSASTGGRLISDNFTLPSGVSGSIADGPVVNAGLLSESQAQVLLGRFPGFLQGSFQLARNPYLVEIGSTPPDPSTLPAMIRSPQNGILALGVNDASHPQIVVGTAKYLTTYLDCYLYLPGKVVLIQSGTAYEFCAVNALYGPKEGVTGDSDPKFNDPTNPGTRIGGDSAFLGMRYVLTRILNRHGDEVLITDITGGYSVTWKSEGNLMPASLQVVSTPVGTAGASNVTVTYSGVANPPAFTITNMRDSMPVQEASQGRNPDTISYLVDSLSSNANESVSFSYATVAGPWSTSYNEYTINNPVQALISVAHNNGRTIALTWTPYSYQRNKESPDVWKGYRNGAQMNAARTALMPQYMIGVSQVDDGVGLDGVRTTKHVRRIPQPDLSASSASFSWLSTTFDDAVIRPDGSVAVTRYVEPLVGSPGSLPEDGDPDHQMQTLAHLKHQVREVREYETQTNWQADRDSGFTLPNNAHRITATDRWTLRNFGNLSGVISGSALPEPTRKRSWIALDGLLTQEESLDWDATTGGWKNHWKWISDTTSPSFGMDIRSAADNPNLTSSDPTGTVYKSQQSVLIDSAWSEWLIGRITREQVRVHLDNSAGREPADTYPSDQPAKITTYETTPGLKDRIVSTKIGEAPSISVTTSFVYRDDIPGGLKSSQISSVSLSGKQADQTDLIQSGGVGISSFGYDATLGYLNSIQQQGVNWSVTQQEDALRRPIDQGDPSGLHTQFGWDSGGRLSLIAPPGGDQVNLKTTIAYDPASATAEISRGNLKTTNVYNPFGEPIIERRYDASGVPSHRMIRYDVMGRPIQMSVWKSGSGNPGNWSLDLVPQGYTVATTVYDRQGRVVNTVDANGIAASTIYAYRKKTVTQGSSSTSFETDALGRLFRVTDARGQVTRYYYDPANRIRTVKQWPGAETGTPQVRTWSYNSLGWLTDLVQPESGTTHYDGFTVLGKPTQATYGYGSSAPKVVTTTFDSIGRVRQIDAPAYGTAPPLKQRFDYDKVGVAILQGKLWHSSDGPDGSVVSRDFSYDPTTGRLLQLDTTLPLAAAPVIQQFSYDAYGHRTGGVVDGRSWTQPYDTYRDLPSGGLVHAGRTIVSSIDYYSDSWALQQLAFGNGVKTSYSYDPDQTRLHSMTHFPTGANPILASWTYTYDGRNNLQQVYDAASGKTEVFTYDELNRLNQAWIWNGLASSALPNQGLVQEFQYDSFGNRILGVTRIAADWTSSAPPAANVGKSLTLLNYSAVPTNSIPVQDISIDPANASLSLHNQIPSTVNGSGSSGASYDAQGNLKTIYAKVGDAGSLLSMDYDPLGRVTSLFNAANSTTEVYSYSPEGLRSVIKVYSGQTLLKTKVNIYNDQRQLVSQYVWE